MIHIGQGKHILIGVDGPQRCSRTSGIIGSVGQIRVAMAVHIHGKDYKTPSGKFDSVGILHLIAIQIPMAKHNSRTGRSVVAMTVVLQSGFGNIHYAAKCSSAGIDPGFAHQDAASTGLY